MKVAIVGAGWFGCHIGTKLLEKGISVEIFESEKQIFSGASGFNQNRLHLGFHYPRSYITRKQSKEGFEKFVREYPTLSEEIDCNLYAIGNKYSAIDFPTYLQVMEASGLSFDVKNPEEFGLTNVEGCIRCDERLINTNKARRYFEDSELNNYVHLETRVEDVKQKGSVVFVNGQKFDLLVDCSGQQFLPTKNFNWELQYEMCLVLVYEGGKNHPAITVMDGPFFTIYPYQDNLYTVYSVNHSTVNSTGYANYVREEFLKFNQIDGKYHQRCFVECVQEQYPSFLDKFKYVMCHKSLRTKRRGGSDSRECSVSADGRIIQVLAGKIDHIFYAWEETWEKMQKYC